MKFFQFDYLNDSENDYKPPNTHLIIEDKAGVLYIVSNADTTIIYKSSDGGATWSTSVDLATGDINNIFYDDSNERLYTAIGVATDDVLRIFYILQSDDSFVQHTNANTIGDQDVIKQIDLIMDSSYAQPYAYFLTTEIDGAAWDVFIRKLIGGGGIGGGGTVHTLEIESNVNSGGSNPISGSDVRMGKIVRVGSSDAYFLYQTTTNHVLVYQSSMTADTWVELFDLGSDWNLPSSVDYHAIAYAITDQDFFFVAFNIGDSKYYLWRYNLITDIGENLGEFNIIIMLDRNNYGSASDTPNQIEKAFEVSGTKAYKLTRLKSGVGLYQDISANDSFTAGSTIIVITDNYLFVDNSGTIEIWKQKDVLGDFITFATVDRIIQEFSKAKITGNIKFSTNQIIELYDNDTVVR